jgi:hypothetical protein
MGYSLGRGNFWEANLSRQADWETPCQLASGAQLAALNATFMANDDTIVSFAPQSPRLGPTLFVADQSSGDNVVALRLRSSETRALRCLLSERGPSGDPRRDIFVVRAQA